MAGVNWLKMTMPRACSMQVHNGQRERAERNHSNADIDKSKSSENFFIGCDDWSDAVQSMRSRVEEVDKLYPPRKKMSVNERIVCVSLVTYCPQEIYDSGRVKEFFEKSDEVKREVLGKENVHGTAVHVDEIHNYIDRDNIERSSLAHGHTLVSAYAEWIDKKSGEERKGINGKNFETKERMKALNKAMDEMCRREFGVSYMTGKGKGKGSGKSVEEVKAETQLRMAVKANDDFVRGLEPSPTKEEKNIFGKSKEVPKSEKELQRDREVKAAQAILEREEALIEKERSIADKERQLERKRTELEADTQAMTEYLAEQQTALKTQAAETVQKLEAAHKLEKQSLIAEFGQKLKAVTDALFASIVQRAVDKLVQIPVPTAAEMLVRNQQQSKQQTQQTKGANEWQR